MAEMQSESFSWRAYGETEQKAKQGILKMWNKQDCYQRERKTLVQLEDYYGISTEECIPANNNYR